jgi:hypothetical protein
LLRLSERQVLMPEYSGFLPDLCRWDDEQSRDGRLRGLRVLYRQTFTERMGFGIILDMCMLYWNKINKKMIFDFP